MVEDAPLKSWIELLGEAYFSDFTLFSLSCRYVIGKLICIKSMIYNIYLIINIIIISGVYILYILLYLQCPFSGHLVATY